MECLKIVIVSMSFDKTKKYIVLDTNIIQYCSNKDLGKKITLDLQSLVSNGYEIAISKFTLFESLDGANIQTEIARLGVINNFSKFCITKNILIKAAHLSCLYKKENLNNISIGDKIIGATAWLRNSMIYTADGNDYPRPYFSEIERKEFVFMNNKNNHSLITIFLLRPENQYISGKHNNNFKKYNPGKQNFFSKNNIGNISKPSTRCNL